MRERWVYHAPGDYGMSPSASAPAHGAAASSEAVVTYASCDSISASSAATTSARVPWRTVPRSGVTTARDAAHARRLQRQDRGADIAAHLGVVASEPGQMRDQRRCGGLAVGAGDGDERRVRRVAATLAAEQFDVADHLDAGLARHQHAPVRRRMRQRRAGGENQRGEIRPGDGAQIGGDEAGLRGLGDVVRIVVGGDDFRACEYLGPVYG